MQPVGYGMECDLNVPYDEALPCVREMMKAGGSGVICKIDRLMTVKETLNIDGAPYVILGGPNPRLTHRELTARAAPDSIAARGQERLTRMLERV